MLEPGALMAGKYRVIALLGEGGMGAVYRAEHVDMDREVALKVIRPDLATDARIASRFHREARAASSLSSPNVVVIHDFGKTDEGTLYLVMELLRGESLGQHMKRDGAIPWRDAVQIALSIARALAAAHDAGIVHRDLKPENVFVCEDGTVKVLDFGIARFVDEDGASGGELTQTGTILGTPRYISPEAAARLPVGPAADLYALGVILFELLTGRPLFDEPYAVLTMSAHLRERAPGVREVRPDLEVPAALDALIGLLLAKEPELRPARAAAIVRELEWSLADPSRKPIAPPPKPAPRRWRPSRIAAGVAIAIAIGAGGWALASLAADRNGTDRRPIAAEPPPAPIEDPPAIEAEPAPAIDREPEAIEIAFVLTPSAATIRHGDDVLSEPRLVVPRDGSEHTFTIDAPGYVPITRTIAADRDREISIVLRRAARAEPPVAQEETDLVRRF